MRHNCGARSVSAAALNAAMQLFGIIAFSTTAGWNDNAGCQYSNLGGKYASSAQFFVAMGIITFIYALAYLAIVLVMADRLNNAIYAAVRRLGPPVRILLAVVPADAHAPQDLLLTVIFALLLLIASAVWTANMNDFTSVCSTAQLQASVAFGFLTWVLWTGNIWFSYKDFRDTRAGGSATATAPAPPPNA